MIEATAISSTQGRLTEKWGDAALAGWMAVPDVLLKNQHRLGLQPTELLVLINILSFWWYAEGLPYPRITTLAKRMGVTPRTVQRSLQKLIEKGLIEKKPDVGQDGVEREVLDPSGLVDRLKKVALDDPSFQYRQRQKVRSDAQKDT